MKLSSSSPSPTEVGEAQETLRRLVREHAPMMLSIAHRVLASEDLAWDAVQETLIRLWIRGLPPDVPAVRLRRLVRLSSLHILRCQRRRRRHEECASAAEPKSCCEHDPLLRLEGSERSACIAAALRSIAERYRRVYVMHELQGKGYAQIAESLGIPIGTVRSRLNRARSLLQDRVRARLS